MYTNSTQGTGNPTGNSGSIADPETAEVAKESQAVNDMAQEWPVVECLLGGTAAMRKAGQAYLPKWPKEDGDAYTSRLKQATLYPALKRTIGVMTGKPFSKQLTMSADTPDEIKGVEADPSKSIPRKAGYIDDITLEGQSLHSFSIELFDEILAYGVGGVLVDNPAQPEVGQGSVVTVAQEKARGIRPYFVRIDHSRWLGWKCTNENGNFRLTQFRYKDVREVDTRWGTKEVPQVRVLYPGRWEVYEQDSKGEFTILAGEGITTIKDDDGNPIIPFVPFYGRRTAFMCGQSPLIDIAYLNVKHWQSQSDQDTILHVARVPILAVIGAENASAVTVGAGAVTSIPVGGDMKYVEHSGAAIKAGLDSLYTLENQMVTVGAELLVMKPGARTATEANNDAEGNRSELQRIVESFEASMDECMELLARWRALPNSGTVSIYKDFGAASLSDASAALILQLQQAGLITRRTALAEQQRRGLLSPDVDIDDEAEAAKDEAPALGLMGMGNGATKPGPGNGPPANPEDA